MIEHSRKNYTKLRWLIKEVAYKTIYKPDPVSIYEIYFT